LVRASSTVAQAQARKASVATSASAQQARRAGDISLNGGGEFRISNAMV